MSHTNSKPDPEIGKEYPIKNEEYYTLKIADRFKRELDRYYESGMTKRIFHPKMHGLVRAEFIVNDNLDDHLKVGIFKEAKTYPAWIRISNAKRHPSHDKKRDLRGFAIKLVGVEGKKLIEGKEDTVTHDFLLVTSKILQTKTVKDFQKSIYALTGNFFQLLFFALTHPRTIYLSIGQIKKCSNLLEEFFFSTTPYKFGDGRAVKYGVIPHQKAKSELPQDPSYNFLKERLIEDLAHKDAYFDFVVQFQEDPVKMPIEDPRKVWDSPFIKLATIKIPRQTFNSDKQLNYGENLSFTPWHCIEAHRPLGGANRARKKVYEIISRYRHERNDVAEREPGSIETFEATAAGAPTTNGK